MEVGSYHLNNEFKIITDFSRMKSLSIDFVKSPRQNINLLPIVQWTAPKGFCFHDKRNSKLENNSKN
jgi:hypothetical protein